MELVCQDMAVTSCADADTVEGKIDRSSNWAGPKLGIRGAACVGVSRLSSQSVSAVSVPVSDAKRSAALTHSFSPMRVSFMKQSHCISLAAADTGDHPSSLPHRAFASSPNQVRAAAASSEANQLGPERGVGGFGRALVAESLPCGWRSTPRQAKRSGHGARSICLMMTIVLMTCLASLTQAAELTQLTPKTWDQFAPQGKEVDCIYGDYVLQNEFVTAVIAEPLATRHGNLTVRNIGGMLIDFTQRGRSNDQLSAYYPLGASAFFESPQAVQWFVDGQPVTERPETVQGKSVAWQATTKSPQGLQVTLRYTLGVEPYLLAETTLQNPGAEPVTFELTDQMRADRSFAFGQDLSANLFWAYDEWFDQAYGVQVDGFTIERGGRRGSDLKLLRNGSSTVTIAAGESLQIGRKLLVGSSLLQVRGLAQRLAGQPTYPLTLNVTDPAGPVSHAQVSVQEQDKSVVVGRTDSQGKLTCELAAGPYAFQIGALGRTPALLSGTAGGPIEASAMLDACGYVRARITDEQGGPIPCKVAFHGVDGTADPNFGPDSADVTVLNLHYSHNGQFRQEIAPGKYDVIISYGPEHDAIFQSIVVERGKETELNAVLRRVVDTRGWVSADFHSHATPSGDNTSSQLGRVLNLLCEQIDFAPCTEHNRISSYVPHLERLGVMQRMATCSGMELTGSPLPINHQNAFPLIHRPRTQDGGGPTTDVNPVVQIERLALWDSSSDKLVQQNHPNLIQILGDKDLNGTADAGFEKMFGFMDAIEVHPPEGIFAKPDPNNLTTLARNPIFTWLQLLNLGYRIPGVVNTDAHYNFHDSGWLRNYLKSSTDDPAQIDTMEMVKASEKGQVIMTTGPFLETTLTAKQSNGTTTAYPGGDLAAPEGQVELMIRVQCPNWLDINRVQLFVNGRPEPKWNWTRREHASAFGDGVVKFETRQTIELSRDAHIIVGAIGEGLELGRVMGPKAGKNPPVAVSNPIFVDVDGGGFKPNRDLLGVPIPLTVR